MFMVKNLNHSYGKNKVLHDISFAFPQGLLVGLWGHNGSGKSTLLKMLGASLPIHDGTFAVFGQTALDQKNYLKPSLRHLFGILLQDFSSDEKISLKDNLFFAARLMGLDRQAAQLRATETLELAELTELGGCLLKTLSGGMRRRLELYRTFMHKPKIVLLDEPTAGLDFSQSKKFLNFLRSYQQRHEALVIFSTHRAREHEVCDQVVMMHQGRILAQDSPQKFLADLNFMTCTFQLISPAGKAILAREGIKLLPKKNGAQGDLLSFNAHLTQEGLEKLLSHKSLFFSAISSFAVSKPNLNDAFARFGVAHDEL